MSNKYTYELDEDFLKEFFLLGECNIEDYSKISGESFLLALKKIKTLCNFEKKDISQYSKIEDEQNLNKVLLIDDLGVITYQLEVLFKRIGFSPIVSKEIYDAIDKFKKNEIKIVIMDLFIPTEREGFILLDELIKIIKYNNLNTKVGIITASNKKEHKLTCLNKGANFYMEKTDNWQKTLMELCQNATENE
ncbi:MAG: response regulator [Candidatus Gastranaerophilales bacterium]|nr:response regulator [Candidatus Gastranaerophilales bacterium]